MLTRFVLLLVGVAALFAGCDTVAPVGEPRLVVEGFLQAGAELPPIRLRQTRPLDAPYADDATTAVTDADLMVRLDDRAVAYAPAAGDPGMYLPAEDEVLAPPRSRFELLATWQGRAATAAGTIPPPIAIDSISVRVPPEPVAAILRDSLQAEPEQGYLYPVEVEVWWRTVFAEVGADSLYWVRARLAPLIDFSSTVVDLFLRPEQILRERTLRRDATGRRSWTGVYAVPVDGPDEALPPHDLNVVLLRSGEDYARFASSRDAPERREPVSNVEGGLGIVVGIALDSLRVHVEAGR